MKKFAVTYTISERSYDVIEAEDKFAAIAAVDVKVDDESWEPEVDEITHIDYDIRELHTVIRDGQRLTTTYVLKTDERCDDFY